jgi:hypothetical protein
MPGVAALGDDGARPDGVIPKRKKPPDRAGGFFVAQYA